MKTALLIFVMLLTTTPQNVVEHYSKDGLAFDYPSGWTLGDTGDAQQQRVVLTRPNASNIIMVFAQREPIKTAGQLAGARANVTMPYVTNIAHKLGLNRAPEPSDQCLSVGGRNAVGFQMTGMLEGEPTTAEVYTVVLGQRLLHLVYLRADKDEAAGAAAWKSVLNTLRVEGPTEALPEGENEIVAGGVLNSKVIKKPQPRYPSAALNMRAQGTVTVQVVVDEKGDVISAAAVSGHQLLQPAGVEAARKAKFQPTTLCGRPVKVSGVITYNFVIM